MEDEIRLLEGKTPLEGRIEICRSNIWGTVCHNGWGSTDARVVCRQLGYAEAGKFLSTYPITSLYYSIVIWNLNKHTVN